jgi:hypothetical protein
VSEAAPRLPALLDAAGLVAFLMCVFCLYLSQSGSSSQAFRRNRFRSFVDIVMFSLECNKTKVTSACLVGSFSTPCFCFHLRDSYDKEESLFFFAIIMSLQERYDSRSDERASKANQQGNSTVAHRYLDRNRKSLSVGDASGLPKKFGSGLYVPMSGSV